MLLLSEYSTLRSFCFVRLIMHRISFLLLTTDVLDDMRRGTYGWLNSKRALDGFDLSSMAICKSSQSKGCSLVILLCRSMDAFNSNTAAWGQLSCD